MANKYASRYFNVIQTDLNWEWNRLWARASIRPSEAKARKPYDKTEFRIEFSGSWKPKIDEFFLIRTTSGDDFIATDKTSTTSTAVWWYDIEKRE